MAVSPTGKSLSSSFLDKNVLPARALADRVQARLHEATTAEQRALSQAEEARRDLQRVQAARQADAQEYQRRHEALRTALQSAGATSSAGPSQGAAADPGGDVGELSTGVGGGEGPGAGEGRQRRRERQLEQALDDADMAVTIMQVCVEIYSVPYINAVQREHHGSC